MDVRCIRPKIRRADIALSRRIRVVEFISDVPVRHAKVITVNRVNQWGAKGKGAIRFPLDLEGNLGWTYFSTSSSTNHGATTRVALETQGS